MRRLLWYSAVLLLVVFCSLSQAQVDTLTILNVNDTHSHLLPYGPKDAGGIGRWGGIARVATLVGMNRMTQPNVMLLHGGDFFVGDFMFQKYLGIPELSIMNQLGFDALELGNHEFDLYPSTLKYVLDQSGFPANGFPVLCANLDFSADPEMAYFVRPYTIKQYGAVKVGIFGLLTEFTNSGSNPSPDVVTPPLDVAQAWIDSLRIGHGCDVVILLSHLGDDVDQIVAGATHGLDVIVGGHSHTKLDQPLQVGSTLIVQAGEFGHYLGRLHLYVSGGVISNWDYQLLTVDESVPQETNISAMLTNLAAGVEADPRFGPVYTTPVARSAIDLDREFGHGLVMDNPMGNLVADAFRKATRTDIAIQPQGFINQQVWAGPVVGNDVFQAVPYGFDQASGLGLKLATFRTDGMSLIAGLEFSVYNLPYLEDFFLHGSNLSFAYNSDNPAGSRVDYSSITVGGKPLNPSAAYTVTVPDGVLPFLSQIPDFNMTNVVITDMFMYSVVRDYMAAITPVAYYREGRILDLAVLADPVEGTQALANLVTVYQTNGSIKKPAVADLLRREFAGVVKSLQCGRTFVALVGLQVIKIQVNMDALSGRISQPAVRTLRYAITKLMESIRQSTGVAWKESEDDVDGSDLPQTFELGQNYPNPFNPTTQIQFTVPITEDVRLEVFNILGQKVATLVDERLDAGEHTVSWDASQQANGVYLYRLAAGASVESKKMILLK